MGVIRQYIAENLATSSVGGRRATAQDFSGNGDGLAALAQGAEAYDNSLEKAEARKQKLEAEKLYSDALVGYTREMEQLRTQYTGDGDFTGQAVALWDKYQSDLQTQISSEDYRKANGDKKYLPQYLKDRFVGARDSIALQSIGFEAQMKAQKQKNDYASIATNAQNIVAVDPMQYGSQKQMMRESIDLLNINPLEKEKLLRDAEEGLATTQWNALPDEQKYQLLSQPNKGGFDAAIRAVMKNEGGYVPIDGSSGAPAIYGINRKWHEKAFDEAQRITKEQGVVAGQKYAQEFYKKEFWDKYNVGSLPPENQTIVMDGVVNHSVAFAKRLVDAARTETPDALIAMRQGEYERLANENPEKYGASLKGWENRLKAVAAEREIPGFSDLSPQAKVKALEDARKYAREDAKLKIEDPAKWGMRRGLSMGQIADSQLNQRTASVLPKETASQLVTQIKQANSLDAFMQISQEVQKSTEGYTNNAILDLRRAGLTNEHEAAMMLISKNPALYNNHIKLLYDVAQSTEKPLDENLKIRGIAAEDVQKAVNEKFAKDEMFTMLAREIGDAGAQDYMARSVSVTSNLAKAYLIQNPSADIKDAVEFALKPQNDSYGIAELNGVKYRVPKDLLASDIEERLDRKYQDYAMELEKTQSDNFSLIKGAVIPVLNDAEDGLFFVDPIGDPIRDANGKTLSISFDELLKVPTTREMQQDFEEQAKGLNADEHEALRRKVFNLPDPTLETARALEENKKLAEKMRKPVGAK